MYFKIFYSRLVDYARWRGDSWEEIAHNLFLDDYAPFEVCRCLSLNELSHLTIFKLRLAANNQKDNVQASSDNVQPSLTDSPISQPHTLFLLPFQYSSLIDAASRIMIYSIVRVCEYALARHDSLLLVIKFLMINEVPKDFIDILIYFIRNSNKNISTFLATTNVPPTYDENASLLRRLGIEDPTNSFFEPVNLLNFMRQYYIRKSCHLNQADTSVTEYTGKFRNLINEKDKEKVQNIFDNFYDILSSKNELLQQSRIIKAREALRTELFNPKYDGGPHIRIDIFNEDHAIFRIGFDMEPDQTEKEETRDDEINIEDSTKSAGSVIPIVESVSENRHISTEEQLRSDASATASEVVAGPSCSSSRKRSLPFDKKNLAATPTRSPPAKKATQRDFVKEINTTVALFKAIIIPYWIKDEWSGWIAMDEREMSSAVPNPRWKALVYKSYTNIPGVHDQRQGQINLTIEFSMLKPTVQLEDSLTREPENQTLHEMQSNIPEPHHPEESVAEVEILSMRDTNYKPATNTSDLDEIASLSTSIALPTPQRQELDKLFQSMISLSKALRTEKVKMEGFAFGNTEIKIKTTESTSVIHFVELPKDYFWMIKNTALRTDSSSQPTASTSRVTENTSQSVGSQSSADPSTQLTTSTGPNISEQAKANSSQITEDPSTKTSLLEEIINDDQIIKLDDASEALETLQTNLPVNLQPSTGQTERRPSSGNTQVIELMDDLLTVCEFKSGEISSENPKALQGDLNVLEQTTSPLPSSQNEVIVDSVTNQPRQLFNEEIVLYTPESLIILLFHKSMDDSLADAAL